jgi:hypothetical protein
MIDYINVYSGDSKIKSINGGTDWKENPQVMCGKKEHCGSKT